MTEVWKDDLKRDLWTVLRKYRSVLDDDGQRFGAAAIDVATAARELAREWETVCVLAEGEPR